MSRRSPEASIALDDAFESSIWLDGAEIMRQASKTHSLAQLIRFALLFASAIM